ncbi:MAG: TAT-variant-translocated molybdopterin oxidoreductase [Planctomycetes bacterium]|nr:TAT-variant-translocated molybdopterin oxidoreductase [Planctomycetota bacterium]
MSPLNRSESTKAYWRSIKDLESTPEFRELAANEFPAGPEKEWTESSRRRFLQIMGASLALGSVSSCRWQKGVIAPMADRPEGWVPGKPRHYSSMMDLGGVAQPFTVTSFDGRPTKVEGNALHPASKGTTNSYAQASVLEMCDPDRSRGVAKNQGGAEIDSNWADLDTFIGAQIRNSGDRGAGMALITGNTTSPSMAQAFEALKKAYPSATIVQHEALSRINEQDGCQQLFGGLVRPVYKLEQANVIVSFDEDLIGSHPDHLAHTRAFAARRRPEDGAMNRLYTVEPSFTLTGSAADHRMPVRASQVAVILSAVQRELASKHHIGTAPTGMPEGGILTQGLVSKFVAAVAKDLAENKGNCVLAAGPKQPAEVHAVVHALNIALGNRGRTVEYLRANLAPATDPSQLAALVARMNAGSINTLVVLDSNPVYTAPADLDFAAALAQVKNKIHFGLYRDETALACDWHAPKAHWLEAWGDGRSWDGTWTLAQPLIEPLYSGKSALEFVSLLVSSTATAGDQQVHATFTKAAGDDEMAWRLAVQRGFVTGSAFPRAANPSGSASPLRMTAETMAAWSNGQPLELVFSQDYSLYDGRYANLGWLQELPDPMSKLTWGNAAIIGISTAAALGVKDEDVVELELDGRRIEAPVYIMPGQAPGTVGLTMGYGRTAAGHVAGIGTDEVEAVGVNAYALRTGNTGFAGGLAARSTGATYPLASTQDHHIIDEIGQSGRDHRLGELIRAADVGEWENHPDFAQHVVHHPPLKSLWKEFTYEGRRWAMSIDLSSCTGCATCTIACQAENNVPIVGKEDVIKGREMAWIRMDRYFTGDPENPSIQNQPINCQHCEMAPCEQVCPVAATTHSEEGLNDMVYNRCIGTRYCANNCPYKVRRFNYLEFQGQLRTEGNEILQLAMNPEVTVRNRGVMEKCSFCVQRIEAARTESTVNGTGIIEDGAVTPACAQVCPAQAISFGDLNDPTSKVLKNHENDRAYALLAELNNKPRVAFMAPISNPHPDLAAAPVAGGNDHAVEEEVQHG